MADQELEEIQSNIDNVIERLQRYMERARNEYVSQEEIARAIYIYTTPSRRTSA